MTGIENYAAFVVAAIIFSVTPGIDTFFVLNRSMSQGKKTGAFSTLGVTTGILVHTLVAAVGLSALIAQSATAFMLIKYLGAAYLIYLGITKLARPGRHLPGMELPSGLRPSSPWKTYCSGVLTNVLNPKVGLFFIAFFPQFISPAQVQSHAPFVVLGLTFATIGLAWLMVLTWLAGSVSASFRRNPRFSRVLDRLSGTAFVAMGANVAFDRS